MRGEHNEFKVGLTVTIVGIVFIAVLVFIGNWGALFKATKPLEVRFHHTAGIQGLRVKDPVRIGGVNVGRVKKTWLQMDKEDGRDELYIYVSAEIPEDITLYRDSKIGIGTKFVGEGGTLDIYDAGREGELLASGEVINGMAPAGFAELTAQISKQLDETDPMSLLSQIKSQLDVHDKVSLVSKMHQSLDDLNAVTSVVRVQLNEDEKDTLLGKLQETMDNVNATTLAIRREMSTEDTDTAMVRVHHVLDHLNVAMELARTMMEQSGPRVTSAVAHVETTAKRVDEQISVSLARELDREDQESLLARIHYSMSEAQTGLENIRVMTQTGKEVFAINRDNLQAIVDNFTETSAHLKLTSKELRRNPWRLLYKPDKPELEYANLLESARSLSEAARALDMANDRLKQIVALDPQGIDADDPMILRIKEEIKNAFYQFEQAQQNLWEILKLKS